METKCLGRKSKQLLLPTVSQYYFTRLSRNLYGAVLHPQNERLSVLRTHSAAGLKVPLFFILDLNMIVLRTLE